jgi:hypothetical protein
MGSRRIKLFKTPLQYIEDKYEGRMTRSVVKGLPLMVILSNLKASIFGMGFAFSPIQE